MKEKEVKTEEIKSKNGETQDDNDNFIVFKIPENMKSKEPNIDLEKLYELTGIGVILENVSSATAISVVAVVAQGSVATASR